MKFIKVCSTSFLDKIKKDFQNFEKTHPPHPPYVHFLPKYSQIAGSTIKDFYHGLS